MDNTCHGCLPPFLKSTSSRVQARQDQGAGHSSAPRQTGRAPGTARWSGHQGRDPNSAEPLDFIQKTMGSHGQRHSQADTLGERGPNASGRPSGPSPAPEAASLGWEVGVDIKGFPGDLLRLAARGPTLRTASLEHTAWRVADAPQDLREEGLPCMGYQECATWVTQTSQPTDGRALRLRKEKPLAGRTQPVGDGAGAPSWGPGRRGTLPRPCL